jgi:hypothetical protein
MYVGFGELKGTASMGNTQGIGPHGNLTSPIRQPSLDNSLKVSTGLSLQMFGFPSTDSLILHSSVYIGFMDFVCWLNL